MGEVFPFFVCEKIAEDTIAECDLGDNSLVRLQSFSINSLQSHMDIGSGQYKCLQLSSHSL